jgi:hypothetical protein
MLSLTCALALGMAWGCSTERLDHHPCKVISFETDYPKLVQDHEIDSYDLYSEDRTEDIRVYVYKAGAHQFYTFPRPMKEEMIRAFERDLTWRTGYFNGGWRMLLFLLGFEKIQK